MTTKFWASLFDQIKLITFLSSCLFFWSINLYLMGFAMALARVAYGGSRILWQLWVTKIAPEGKISEYMSLNSAVVVSPPFWVIISSARQMPPSLVGLPAFCWAFPLSFSFPSGVCWTAAKALGNTHKVGRF